MPAGGARDCASPTIAALRGANGENAGALNVSSTEAKEGAALGKGGAFVPVQQ